MVRTTGPGVSGELLPASQDLAAVAEGNHVGESTPNGQTSFLYFLFYIGV